MGLNKKGFIFTSAAILLLTIFFISYGIHNFTKEESDDKRIKTLNTFVFSLEEDLERKIYISGFRIIFLFQKRTIETGEFITDFDDTVEELFFNGTIYGEEQEPGLIENIVYNDIVYAINQRSNKTNVGVEITNPSIEIYQEDPWNFKTVFEADFIIKDLGGLALWEKREQINTTIPITGFEDPIYFLNSPITNQFNKTPYTTFVSGSDISNLTLHLESSYYTNSTLAPSFLDRLQGNTDPSPYGIESLVNFPDLSAQGVTPKDKTAVDYIYFSTSNPSTNKISGMPSWFKLDAPHLNIYNVSHLTT